ncbi:OmpA family protein [Motilimonas pumila]|uniref:Type IV secretion system putative lipoprotein virB7 n=1 Tax=Motilimonas pumila TaxID=2303987 RepID=A0A418YDM7_9GAMM|nr:OmpA family protein [Motilimonas pumila]RJG42636.1 hypothetical protein D1Z90_12265 [Motilimonas pumila]
MKKIILTAISLAVLAGCSAQSVEPIAEQVATAKADQQGACILAVHQAGEAITYADRLVANAPNGKMNKANYAEAQQAAEVAVAARAEVDASCGARYDYLASGLKHVENDINSIYAEMQLLPAVVFEEGSAHLTPEALTILEAVAARLVQTDNAIEVAGHASDTGTPEANLLLSQQRAEAVKAFLVSQGVLAERLTLKGFGETQPVATNDTLPGQTANKRVELRMLK